MKHETYVNYLFITGKERSRFCLANICLFTTVGAVLRFKLLKDSLTTNFNFSILTP